MCEKDILTRHNEVKIVNYRMMRGGIRDVTIVQTHSISLSQSIELEVLHNKSHASFRIFRPGEQLFINKK